MDQFATNAEKVAFFRSMFVGRKNVFARQFESAKTGKKGYSPCCENQWVRGVCGLFKGWKCSDCPNRKFVAYSDEVVRWHLRGFDSDNKPFEMGIYPMDTDETVSFAVIDFDKSSWRRDALAVVQKVREVGLPVALERSWSGKGAHIWFFLSEPMSAKMVRTALSYIITLTLESHPEISLDSYDDKRFGGIPLDVTFQGELRPKQEIALDAIMKHNCGILAAGTAFGKTIIAIRLIAKRRTNTLVLVNRRQLQIQWISKIAAFLGVEEKSVGKIGGGSNRWTGKIDVALIQSLSRKGYLDPRVKEYGQIIVDECHAVGAGSYETLVDSAPCRYMLGLSATVARNDGHDPLVLMQLGPVRHHVDAKTLAQDAPFAHIVYVRQTGFRLKQVSIEEGNRFNYVDMINEMIADVGRNRLIVEDVLAAVEEGRSPVILTDRKEHVEGLEGLLNGKVAHVLVLTGGMGAKTSREMLEKLRSIPDAEERVVISTGAYIGEGFDDSRLDTLFLATPISWKGRLTQYAGRLHRLHDGKKEVRIYDYYDSNVAVCEKMFEKRRVGYKAIGYEMMIPKGATDGWPSDVLLPVEPKWNERFSESVRRLCRDGVDEALADLFIRVTMSISSDEEKVRIKSKGEIVRFLQQRLNTIRGGLGRFREYVRLPIACGANPYLEVDLWNEERKVAVLFDSKEKLADILLYRIARNEDVLLQKNGIKVVRLLLEDVCENLDDVLKQIELL